MTARGNHEEEHVEEAGSVVVPPLNKNSWRNDAWLKDRVRLLWEMHFSDVPTGFPIVASFGTRAKYRFGSIMARNATTLITVNQLFRDPYVPTYVFDGTLVHGLAHYAHGF